MIIPSQDLHYTEEFIIFTPFPVPFQTLPWLSVNKLLSPVMLLILGSIDFNIPFLIDRVFPEFVLIVLLLNIAVSSLFIDVLVTVSTAYLYLFAKEK